MVIGFDWEPNANEKRYLEEITIALVRLSEFAEAAGILFSSLSP